MKKILKESVNIGIIILFGLIIADAKGWIWIIPLPFLIVSIYQDRNIIRGWIKKKNSLIFSKL
ncbi:MAG: hypothetical protein L7U31_03495 [Flavobacteriaceae bacterium]|nr:hypothetical protein [Flavobacteriaceae bacterium]